MSFLENDTSAQERFSLLLLEPAEIYFEDFSVFYYPSGLPEAEAIKKRQRGHLKICSKSIVFVPSDNLQPILKFPMRDIKEMDEWCGGLFSRLDCKGKMLKIISEQVVQMKDQNVIAPYVFDKKRNEYLFSLNYVSAEDCLPQMCQLHRASTLPLADQMAMVNAIVLSRQSRVKFNTSWLGDLYEKIVFETQGDRITPLVINPGRVMLTSSRLYFQPFNNIDPVPVIKIRLKDLTRVIKRRFLLRQLGLEIFCHEGPAVQHIYLALKNEKSRDLLYTNMLKQSDLHIENVAQEDMTLKWQSGHISNFDYLIYLNSVADRSFSDLTQYPVMPWVVADYTSSQLDLNDPATFRDLSKPMGALNEDRLQRLKERFESMGEPRFLYGSHYSTPGYVLFYLARISPEYVLCLQNGKFDQADRMFNNLQETWHNCLTGAADFKELIPEFYSGKTDFLVDHRTTNFGTRQSGKPVGDVELPPWASGPQDFLHKLRMALESDYVSHHLNEWIDLIFGCKQRGEEAIKANNVFYYLTYEGAVNLESIVDLNERACLEIQLMEFGQVPKQLFHNPHPQRFSSAISPRSLAKSLSQVEREIRGDNCIEEIQNDVVEEEVKDSLDLQDLQHLKMYSKHSLHKDCVSDVHLSPDGKSVFSVSQDALLKMYSLEDQRQLRSVNMSNMALSSFQILPDDRTIVVASWDNNVYFYSIEYGRVVGTLLAHDDAVSGVHWINDLLVTSSWDSTVKVWQFSLPSSSSSFQLPEFLGQLDHESGVTCMGHNEDGNLLLTATKHGQISSWDMNSFFLMSQHSVHRGTINALLYSCERRQTLSCGEDCTLRVLDMETGTEIFSRDMKLELMCLAWVGGLLVAGDVLGNILVWDMEKAQLVHTLTAHTDAVTCIGVFGQKLLTGSRDRSVCIWRPSG